MQHKVDKIKRDNSGATVSTTDKEGNFIGIEPLTTNSIINLLVTDPQGFIGNKKIDYANTFGLGNNYDWLHR